MSAPSWFADGPRSSMYRSSFPSCRSFVTARGHGGQAATPAAGHQSLQFFHYVRSFFIHC